MTDSDEGEPEEEEEGRGRGREGDIYEVDGFRSRHERDQHVQGGYAVDEANNPSALAYTNHRGSPSQRHTGYSPPTERVQAAAMAAAADEDADPLADEEQLGPERIARMLREMMARQRARAKGKSTAEPHSHSFAHARARSRNPTRPRRRKRAVAAEGSEIEVNVDVDFESSMYGHDNDTDHDVDIGYGDTESEAEKEELMGLIVSSLRREVAKAEEEAWMFGDVGGIGGIRASGREEGT